MGIEISVSENVIKNSSALEVYIDFTVHVHLLIQMLLKIYHK
jgi:hypothetical protein